MLRLLIIADEPERWQAVEARLTAIAIEARRALPDTIASFDAVVIANSIADSKATLEAILQAGKHVLWAADNALTRQDIASLQATARQAKVQFAIVNPDRFLPSRQLIKQQIPDKIGQAGLVRIQRWESSSARLSSMLRDLDLALWLVGAPPDRVFATENRLANSRILQVHLGFPGGSMALIDHTDGLPPGDGYLSLSVIGSTGAAYADDHQNVQLLYKGGRPHAVPVEEGIRQAVDMLQWFATALTNAGDQSANLAAWQQVYAVNDAITQSLHSKQAVPLR
jgi:predicted dehydrogenase